MRVSHGFRFVGRLYKLFAALLVASAIGALSGCTTTNEIVVEGHPVRPGEIAVAKGKIFAPHARILRQGKISDNEADLPPGAVAGVMYKNNVYLIYNPGFSFFDELSDEISRLSIAMYALGFAEHYQHNLQDRHNPPADKIVDLTSFVQKIDLPSIALHFGKCSWWGQTYDYELHTGIGIDIVDLDAGEYAFTNCKRRWASVELNGGVKFLPPPNLIDGIIGTIRNIFQEVSQSRKVVVQVHGSSVVDTYGAIVRLVFFPAGAIYRAITDHIWADSIVMAYDTSPETFIRVNAVDLLSVIEGLLQEVVGIVVPADSCVDTVIGSTSSAIIGEAIDALANENIHTFKEYVYDSLTSASDCMAQVACDLSPLAAGCEAAYKLASLMHVAEIVVAGNFDAENALAYESFRLPGQPNPSPPGAILRNLGVPLGDGLWNGSHFLVVGDAGTVKRSGDGVTWQSSYVGERSNLWGVTWSDALGKYVAVGGNANPHVYISENGLNWEIVDTNAPSFIYDAISLQPSGKVIAVGGEGTILVSSDARHWAKKDVGGSDLVGVGQGPGATVLAVGKSGAIAISYNGGEEWERISSNTRTDFRGVAYGRNTYVIVGGAPVGEIWYSSDPKNGWIKAQTPSGDWLWDATFGEGYFVAVGEGGTILSSKDGMSWKKVPRICGVDIPHEWWHDVSFSQGLFVVTGWHGHVLIFPSTCLAQ